VWLRSLSNDPIASLQWVATARCDEPAKLNEVDPSLARFDFRYPAMGNLQMSGEIALREPCMIARGTEFGAQRFVLWRML
jgi:hypothetical protein